MEVACVTVGIGLKFGPPEQEVVDIFQGWQYVTMSLPTVVSLDPSNRVPVTGQSVLIESFDSEDNSSKLRIVECL